MKLILKGIQTLILIKTVLDRLNNEMIDYKMCLIKGKTKQIDKYFFLFSLSPNNAICLI